MTGIDIVLLIASALLLASVLASKASDRFGIPALLIFIGIGVLAGSEGPGGIDFNNYFVAQSVGVAALAAILFDGGLRTEWRHVRPVLWQGVSLSTVGVAITAVLVGLFARLLFDLSWLEALLLGSIVSSTDAAAVFSILRSRRATLKGASQPLLELESGSNDPMAVFLTVGMLFLITQPDSSPVLLLGMFAQQLLLGGVLGYSGGKFMTWAVNRVRLDYEGLYPAFTIGVMLLLYSGTATLGGSGFLAVYIAGLLLGNSDFIHKKSLIRFHNGVAWLAQIAMFLTLGLLVFPSHLVPIAFSGTVLALFSMFVARPISAFLALPYSKLSLREKTMVSWVGLRGAAPIILATFPLLAGIPQAELIFNIVFFVVLMSVVFQGASIPWVAEKLGLSAPMQPKRKSPLEFEPSDISGVQLKELVVRTECPSIGRQIVELGIPKTALIVLLTRGSKYMIPRGETHIEAGDVLLVLANAEDFAVIQGLMTRSRAPDALPG